MVCVCDCTCRGEAGEGWWVVKGGGGGSVVEWEGGVEKKIPFLGCDFVVATV